MSMQTQLIIRVDAELKAQVSQLAAAEGKNLSETMRELMIQYVKDRDRKGYITALWDELGQGARARGFTEQDIDSMIQQVREENAQSRS